MSDKLKEKERLDRQIIALRVAKEFQDGDIVNLGIGIPMLASNFIPAGREVVFHSENGVLGFGQVTLPGEGDLNLVNAGGQTVHRQPGMSFFGHDESFAMIRGGHLDTTIMGAYQVSERGDLANWKTPEQSIGAIGGGMDLVFGAKRVIVLMEHTDRSGRPKVVKECSYPLTARGVVDLIITDMAVIGAVPEGLELREVAPGITPEEIQAVTEPKLIISKQLKEIEF